eukprot:CAMPEP_0167781602 /NCGR_PEP_ID=MMETSP0111_2-20121227/6027_1 /TAXON_ID=91324 /ORGANISM="Lotharella globosa, Strain CCCM811" /LENGTH=147 /DNA_ID=CAMNT_0007672289 /DNA_START=40 /DNA_END=480 /DNA_ORIENTATION=-
MQLAESYRLTSGGTSHKISKSGFKALEFVRKSSYPLRDCWAPCLQDSLCLFQHRHKLPALVKRHNPWAIVAPADELPSDENLRNGRTAGLREQTLLQLRAILLHVRLDDLGVCPEVLQQLLYLRAVRAIRRRENYEGVRLQQSVDGV